MKGKEERYPDYALFKGLQRPLELMGIQGRYIYWAAGAAGSHRRLHPRLLPCGIRGRTGHAGRRPLDVYRTHHLQTAERTAQQEGGPRRCLLYTSRCV